MIKYNFVLHHADLPAFLENLQTLGIVDVKRCRKPIDEHSNRLMDDIVRYTNVYKLLDKIKVENPEPIPHKYSAEYIFHRVETLKEEKNQTIERKTKLLREIELATPWREWEHSTLEQLASLGLKPHFYVQDEKKYNPAWEQTFPLQIINKLNGKIYFFVLEQQNEPYVFPLQDAKFPAEPINILTVELENINLQLQTIQQELEQYASLKEQIAVQRAALVEDLELYLAGKSAGFAASNTIAVLTAFVPEGQKNAMEQLLDTKEVVYLSKAATIEDDPPVQLKNNRFARLFEPIGSMYMPPKYNELDTTAFFSPFYMLFFGFCLGDLGYGMFLLLLSSVAKPAVPKMKSLLTMVQLLGLGAVIMPLASGTFFGLKLGDMFHLNNIFLDDLQMFWFAIAFGAVQLIFAKIIHGIDMIRRKGWQHGLSSLGWGFLMISGGLVVCRSILNLPVPSWLVNAVLYTSLAMILFFTSLSNNLLVRIGKGVASAYDVTGIFGDLLSYIRLFGLATSGGILGFVVNTVGGMCWNVPYVGYVIGGLVFVVGHVAVLALSSLGAFVHPMRLTFVEFYKNIGFTGGGRMYKPLKKENK